MRRRLSAMRKYATVACMPPKVLGPACKHVLAAAAHAVMIRDEAVHGPLADKASCMAFIFSWSSRARLIDAQHA